MLVGLFVIDCLLLIVFVLVVLLLVVVLVLLLVVVVVFVVVVVVLLDHANISHHTTEMFCLHHGTAWQVCRGLPADALQAATRAVEAHL